MTRRLTALFAVILAACGGGGGDPAPVTPPPTPTIALSLASASGTATRGGSATTTISLARGGGYTGTVTLAATGAPSGVEVAIAPSTLSGATSTATATISVGATAAPGTATITITATGSGVAAATTSYTLTIPTPGIGVSAAAAGVSIAQGISGNLAVSVSRTNGYTDAITLTASGLPAGATATFTPASVPAGATASTLVIAVPLTTPVGTYPITITASGTGVANATTTVSLTVLTGTAPGFGLSASPANLSLTAGESLTSTITVARSGGFAGDVALTVSGAPAGMTATLAPTTIAANGTTSTLSVATTTAVVPGNYTLTVNGTGAGVAAQSTSVAVTVTAPLGIALAASAATTTGAAGGTASLGVTLTRTGGYASDVTLAVGGLPSGVTAAFVPGILSGANVSSTLTLTIGASVAPGNYNLSLNAAGAGGVSAQTPVTLSVTAVQDFSLAATAVSLAQGGTGTSTVTITRTAGFTGTVNLSLGSLPSGVSATISPSAVTGNSATISFTATAGATTGAFNTTVTGTSGSLSRAAAISGAVTPGGGGGSGNINWRFCDLEDLPLFVAFRAGTSGAWTRVLPSANNTYSFTLGGPGSVVIVRPGNNVVANIQQYNFTAAEMAGTAEFECTQNPASKTLTGTVAGLSDTQTAQISVGGATATITNPTTAYMLTDVSTGTTDLLAFRAQQTVGANFIPTTTPDRAILRRNVDYSAASAIPVLDFNGAEAFAPASATYTLSGAIGGEITQILSFFNTTNGTSAGFLFGSLLNTSGSATVYGVPTNRLASSDFHFAMGFSVAQDASNQRGVYQYNRELVNRTLTLGPLLSTPTVSTVGTAPYVRLRSAGTWQTDYADGIGVTFQQGTTNSNTRSWTISQSRAFLAGASYQLEIPDLTGTSGWNTSWGLITGLETTVSTSATGGAVQAFITPSEGAAFRQASRTTRITP